MKNKIISIISITAALIYFGASYYLEVLPKWISILIAVAGLLPQIFSWREDSKEKENIAVLDLLTENTKMRKDLSEKEKEFVAERNKNQEWELIVRSLKNKSISKENLIRKYSKPLPVILLQYGNQKVNNVSEKFITQKLESEYDVKSLGGSLKVIPPNKVPKNIKNGVDLKKWFEEEIQSKYKGSSCVISVLAIVDLKNIYWKSDYNFDVRYYKALGKILKLDDIFDKNEISYLLASENISILDPILSGDVSFLCSNFMSDKELDIIQINQEEIEKKLDNASLRELADTKNIEKITSSLSNYFKNNEEIAKRINQEAVFWLNKLDKNGTTNTN